MYISILLLVSVLTLIAYASMIFFGYTEFIMRHFFVLTSIASVLIVSLLCYLFYRFWKLNQENKQNIFGSRIMRQLLDILVWVCLFPTLFIMLITFHFITYTSNTWFGEHTEKILEHSQNISKAVLQNFANNAHMQAIQMTNMMAQNLENRHFQKVIQEHTAAHFTQIMVFADSDRQNPVLAFTEHSDPNPPVISTDSVFPKKFPENLSTFHYLENINHNNTIYTQTLIPRKINQKSYWFFFSQQVPNKTLIDITLIDHARNYFQSITQSRNGLQVFFSTILIITALIAMLLSLWLATLFSRRFIQPLRYLNTVAQSVSTGDFSKRAPIFRTDELGILSARFNRMAQQLDTNRTIANKLYQRQEQERRYLELVFSSLSSGILSLDKNGCLRKFNEAAENMLPGFLSKLIGKPLYRWVNEGVPAACLGRFVLRTIDYAGTNKSYQFEYTGFDKTQFLVGKAAKLDDDETNTIIIFDDITTLMEAQKESAWGEVARRLAHEIKNPLTPIQLSAERLQLKLTDHLDAKNNEFLNRSTTTIINQVNALKEMLEGFRNYARVQHLDFVLVNLNQLIDEVLVLYENSQDCHFSATLIAEPLIVKIDVSAFRQVLHNLLKNAQEAAVTDKQPKVEIVTSIYENKAQLQIINNGLSFEPEILQHAFEPYVTNKKAGTGLGLSVVKKIIDEHNGEIFIANGKDSGAIITIYLHLTENLISS